MKIAAYLHDLGKLAIPREILEKEAPLTNDEFSIIKSHAYHTFHIIRRIPAFSKIAEWSSHHHERPDGNGYPFHLNGHEMELGAKIMAVADVFTALTEDRPYRKALDSDEALKIMTEMAQDGGLHELTLHLLKENVDEMRRLSDKAQRAVQKTYELFFSAAEMNRA